MKHSKRDEEELETFIETRQKELEDWKKDEAENSEKLERIRLDASASQQKESFMKGKSAASERGDRSSFQKESRRNSGFSGKRQPGNCRKEKDDRQEP